MGFYPVIFGKISKPLGFNVPDEEKSTILATPLTDSAEPILIFFTLEWKEEGGSAESWPQITRLETSPKLEIAPFLAERGDHGSPGWTRTNNQVINSHLLCQLSYRGSALCEETYLSRGEVSILAGQWILQAEKMT